MLPNIETISIPLFVNDVCYKYARKAFATILGTLGRGIEDMQVDKATSDFVERLNTILVNSRGISSWGTCIIDARCIWLNLELTQKKPVDCSGHINVYELFHL